MSDLRPRYINLKWKDALCSLTLSALSASALLGATGGAQAGYTCTGNTTAIDNTVTTVIVATSGGSSQQCTDEALIEQEGTTDAHGEIVSAKVGATVGGLGVRVAAIPYSGSPASTTCNHGNAPGVCTSSLDRHDLDGVETMTCEVGLAPSVLPDPALPLVPVVITTTCAFTLELPGGV